jgi:uncharacterized protein
MREVIREKIADAVSTHLPELTRREVRLPGVPGKVHAVIGMRRAGKTCFLHQCQRDLLAAGFPREALVYFSFDDERLAGMELAQMHWILEEYFLLHPEFRDTREVAFFFDEIQSVPGWESFVRRILDTEKVKIFVSGSSAKLLSREIATNLRGRAMETCIYPFSFREYLRHFGREPLGEVTRFTKAQRSLLEKAFLAWLSGGGFPEAQGLTQADRVPLLQGYVDTVILRDVMERHSLTNVTALRQLTRHLLGSAASPFSVHRFFNDLKSRSVPASKEGLHSMLGYLEDAFLIRLLPIHTSSERQRQSNPRKAYPVDPGLIHAFDRSGKSNLGHALETAVLIELQRRNFDCAYVRTTDGYEVDFLATPLTGRPMLIQVCADVSDTATRSREFRALGNVLADTPKLPALLLTLGTTGMHLAHTEAPTGITVRSAWEWMLTPEGS